MEKQTFTIPNISCGHCVTAIKNELGEMAGIQSIDGDPEKKTITVSWKPPVSAGGIRSKLAKINYPAA